MHVVAALALTICCHVALADMNDFLQFQAKYGKHYRNSSEEHTRYTIFASNLDLIRSHNNNPADSFRLAMNKFGDMTLDEFANWLTQSTTPLPGSNPNSFLRMPAANLGNVHESVDWQSIGAFLPLDYQDKGRSNHALVSAAVITSSWAIRNSEIIPASAQQLIDCINPGGYMPGNVTADLWYATNGPGLCSSEAYPFTGRSTDACRHNRCTHLLKIKSFQHLYPNDEHNLKLAVLKQPVISFMSIADPAIMFYSTGIYSGLCPGTASHAVAIVGYGTESETGQFYWKIANTWGKDWGESSYIRLSRSTESDSPGTCRIASDPIYIHTY